MSGQHQSRSNSRSNGGEVGCPARRAPDRNLVVGAERMPLSSASTALLLALWEEDELVEVDGLVAGSASAVPTLEDGLEGEHRLWEC